MCNKYEFTPTKFSTVQDKARFYDHLVGFIEKDFTRDRFHQWFYQVLSNCFGHIAHYNSCGFYEKWFSTTDDKIMFLENIMDHTCCGDPKFTFSDVERKVQSWVAMTNHLHNLRRQYKQEIETSERLVYEKLKAKYDK